jgi:hypothetical protein
MPRVFNKVKEEEVVNSFAQAIREIKSHPSINVKVEENTVPDIVDIMKFCEGKEYLNLPDNHLTLWISQRVILKSFYMGSIGNETLTLNQEEWEWLYKNEKDEILNNYTYTRNIKDVIKNS